MVPCLFGQHPAFGLTACETDCRIMVFVAANGALRAHVLMHMTVSADGFIIADHAINSIVSRSSDIGAAVVP
jgi:hypothetical protein